MLATSSRPRHFACRRAVVLATSAALGLAGCALGERPTLAPATAIDDAAIAAVFDRLDRADSATFTATYDIVSKFGGVEAAATVVQNGGSRRISIGDVDFIIEDDGSRTCADGECVDSIDDAQVSDLQITHRFWGESAQSRLEIDATRNIGSASGSVETIAGHPAACVDVPVVGGDKIYCALDAGPLARYDGADVSIELTSFSVEAGDLGASE